MWCSDQNVLWSLTCPESTSSIPADRIFRLHNQTWNTWTEIVQMVLNLYFLLYLIWFWNTLRLAMINNDRYDWMRLVTRADWRAFPTLEKPNITLSWTIFCEKTELKYLFLFLRFLMHSSVMYCNLNKRLIWVTLEIWHRYYL